MPVLFRTGLPVVMPTHDAVRLLRIMSMGLEVTRPILKLNSAHLPFAPCPAVWESYLNIFDAKAQFLCKSSKKKDDAMVGRGCSTFAVPIHYPLLSLTGECIDAGKVLHPLPTTPES